MFVPWLDDADGPALPAFPISLALGGYSSLRMRVAHKQTEEKNVNFSMDQTWSLAANMCENTCGLHVNSLPSALHECQLPASGF